MNQISNWNTLTENRYLKFWDKDSPLVIMHIQNPNLKVPDPEAWMLETSEEKYLNPEKFYRLQKWRRETRNWHGDLFNYIPSSYGPSIFAGFSGGNVEFGKDTVWCEPVINSLDEADKIHFDEDNRYWKAHLETLEYFAEQSSGKEFFALSDLGGTTDWIASLMGAEQFLMETIMHPDKMRDLAMRMATECNRAIEIIISKFGNSEGYVNWMPFWSDLPLNTVQDDMAINLSPEMYDGIFLPALQLIAGKTDRTMLHWHDGAPQHLDSLLQCQEIDMVQYGHDPTSGDFKDGIEAMQKIQASGKKLFISCVEAADADFFLENLDHNGLAMIVNTDSDEESKRMYEKMVKD